jgi:sodium/pantothenate symporter
MRALTFKDSRAMHQGMVLSTALMFVFTCAMMFAGVAANVVLGPRIGVPDSVIPNLIMKLFPRLLAGIVLAVPFSAIMSTVSSMLLVCANGLVGDLYVDLAHKPLLPSARARLDQMATAILGGVVFMLALAPPRFLQQIVFYAIGGLASCFLVPLLFGLYWRRANTSGAVSAIGIGTLSFILISRFLPNPLQLHSVAWSITLAATAMVTVSLLTERPAPYLVAKFWADTERSVPLPANAIAERETERVISS